MVFAFVSVDFSILFVMPDFFCTRIIIKCDYIIGVFLHLKYARLLLFQYDVVRCQKLGLSHNDYIFGKNNLNLGKY